MSSASGHRQAGRLERVLEVDGLAGCDLLVKQRRFAV